jgi:hypothetical protein
MNVFLLKKNLGILLRYAAGWKEGFHVVRAVHVPQFFPHKLNFNQVENIRWLFYIV